MDEQKENIRPTKKQRELLEFIEAFIAEHDYSPSYREIMNGCNYTSVATVSLHVNNLIRRGHLVKREHSARSLEVVKITDENGSHQQASDVREKAWLLAQTQARVDAYRAQETPDEGTYSQAHILLQAAALLGCDEVKIAQLQDQLSPAVEP